MPRAKDGKKVCSKCREEKDVTEFYADKGAKDGLYSRCKECHIAVTSDYFQRNRKKIYDWKNKWRREDPRQRLKTRECSRKYRERNPEKARLAVRNAHAKYWKTYYERHREKNLAGQKLRYAVKRGKVLKPTRCSKCKELIESQLLQGHHEDYTKPLEAIWLCAKCHKAIHRRPF